jgi:formyl-CoA transferase
MALLDVGMAILANQAAGFLNTGRVPQRQGNGHPSLVPYQDFETLDGAMLLAVGNDGQFARFCDVAGHPEWALDPRFILGANRVHHRTELVDLMQAVTRTRSTADWIGALEDQAVPCGPINTIGEAFADVQVQARGLKVSQASSLEAAAQTGVAVVNTVASPMRLQDTPPVLRSAPPALGEHTDAVLAELGLDATAIAALRSASVV